jgi:GNAT superfamily N-acetyltransferase
VTLTFEKATPADEPVIRQLQDEAIAWLATKGTDQWQPGSMRNPRRDDDRGLSPAIARGEVYLVRDSGGEVVATFTLDDYADPEFWTQDDAPSSALYVHRMVVARNAVGRGIGARILDWCAGEVALRGKEWLRIDAWRTNERLHQYYLSNGFAHVRTLMLNHRGSGALFQRPIQREQTP